MSPDQVTQFAERLVIDSGNVASILTYPHPFTDGGVVIIFDDSVASYARLHASVMRANPPPGDRRIVKRSDLFFLSVPNTKAMAPYDYPYNVYYLKNKGKVIFGEDLREQIPEPYCVDSMLVHVLDATACWFRAHSILRRLQQQKFYALMEEMDMRLRFLMSIALLTRTGQWEVQPDLVPVDFLSAFAGEDLQEAWHAFDELIRSTGDQNADRAIALQAVWFFEVFTRGLRRYA